MSIEPGTAAEITCKHYNTGHLVVVLSKYHADPRFTDSWLVEFITGPREGQTMAYRAIHLQAI